MVATVPQSLPLVVSISLAYTVIKMKKENNILRNLEASETMGITTEVCTGITGILTKNQMTVVEYYSMGDIHKANDQSKY